MKSIISCSILKEYFCLDLTSKLKGQVVTRKSILCFLRSIIGVLIKTRLLRNVVSKKIFGIEKKPFTYFR